MMGTDTIIIMKIESIYLKRQLLRYCLDERIHFMEVDQQGDIEYRLSLVGDRRVLLIYEADQTNVLENYQVIDKLNHPDLDSLVILHEYDPSLIKQAHHYQINDVEVHPIDFDRLTMKIQHFLMGITTEQAMVKSQFDLKEVEKEINRAKRGNYPLSLAMAEVDTLSQASIIKVYFQELEARLRETDRLFLDEGAKKILILCPFTEKNYLVEVENKVRDLFAKMKEDDSIDGLSRIYLHGLAFGVDGDEAEDLLKQLDSKLYEHKRFEKEKIRFSAKPKNWQWNYK